MKTKEIKHIDKTVIEQLRDIRDKVSFDIQDLTLEQVKDYFNNQKTLHPKAVWRNKE